jgi:hypothetical protein
MILKITTRAMTTEIITSLVAQRLAGLAWRMDRTNSASGT